MDWDSPTTRKHIAEAEAQGCELLGEGKSCHYRTYRLPCGHEQEFDLGRMRTGSFRCQTCLDDRLIVEAAAQNCELLGPSERKGHRIYRLPCGHEKEISTNGMRTGSFRCQTCLDDRLVSEAAAQGCTVVGSGRNVGVRLYRLPCGHEQEIGTGKIRTGAFWCQACIIERLHAEAEAQGCELLGPGKDYHYRMYRLPCGHEQEFDCGQMRKGQISCQTCLQEKLSAEADAAGCELLGPGNHRAYRIYRLPCGHVQEVITSHIRLRNFRCQACQLEKLTAEAKAQGCELLEPGKNFDYRLYLLPCGHTQEINVARVRDGQFWCQTCLAEKLISEAKLRSCELLRPGKNKDYRFYQLPCGHKQDIAVASMRLGSFLCHTCEDTFYTLPSQAYLLHIKVGADEWLKLGYAKDVDFRTSRYGLPSEAEVSVLATSPFDTGKEAREFEGILHKKHRHKRLRGKDMKDFFTGSGFTECYPVLMVEKLMAEFRSQK